QTNHAPDERIQRDQQAELTSVDAETEPDERAHARAPTVPARLAAMIRTWSPGAGGISETSASANTSGSATASIGLCARSKPIEETGFPESPRPQTEPA